MPRMHDCNRGSEPLHVSQGSLREDPIARNGPDNDQSEHLMSNTGGRTGTDDSTPRARGRDDATRGGHVPDGPEKRAKSTSTSKPLAPASDHPAQRTNVRTGLDRSAIAAAVIDNLYYLQGTLPQHATRTDWYMALAYAVRDRLMDRYIATADALSSVDTARVVAYLSAEFLIGPQLGNALINLGIWTAAEDAMNGLGEKLAGLLEQEEEPGLGNGGLGRLAACYMDSLSTLAIPAICYGIR